MSKSEIGLSFSFNLVYEFFNSCGLKSTQLFQTTNNSQKLHTNFRLSGGKLLFQIFLLIDNVNYHKSIRKPTKHIWSKFCFEMTRTVSTFAGEKRIRPVGVGNREINVGNSAEISQGFSTFSYFAEKTANGVSAGCFALKQF